jgi:hypothetical protein
VERFVQCLYRAEVESAGHPLNAALLGVRDSFHRSPFSDTALKSHSYGLIQRATFHALVMTTHINLTPPFDNKSTPGNQPRTLNLQPTDVGNRVKSIPDWGVPRFFGHH